MAFAGCRVEFPARRELPGRYAAKEPGPPRQDEGSDQAGGQAGAIIQIK